MKVLITLMILLAYLPCVQAAEPPARPTIVFFYVDELNVSEQDKREIKRDTIAKFENAYSPSCTLWTGDTYSSEFAVTRFTDLANLDRFDLLPKLAKDKVDYVVFYNVLPLRTKKDSLFQLVTTTSNICVRVFDVNQNKYISDRSFTHKSSWAWLSDHFEKLFAAADRHIFKPTFPVKAGS